MNMLPGHVLRVPQAPEVTFTADVETSDGHPAPANTQAGFLQTLHSSNRVGHYRDANGASAGTFTVSRQSSMDQDTDLHPAAPWYNPTLPMTGPTVHVGGRDAPYFDVPHDQNEGAAMLTQLSGADHFRTWVAVKLPGQAPTELGWRDWSVSWRATVDASYFAHGGGVSLGAHGEGRGDQAPETSGTPPNLGSVGAFQPAAAPAAAAAPPGGQANSGPTRSPDAGPTAAHPGNAAPRR